MSDIRTSITLVDNFSSPAKGMAAAMNAAASECEKMKKVMGTAPDMSEYNRVREQFTALGDAERQAAVQAKATADALDEQADKLRMSAQAAQAKADAEQKAVAVYEQEYRAYEKNANELGVLTEAQKKSIDRYREAYEEKKKAAEGAQNLADRLKLESEMADKAAQSARKEADAYGEVNTVTGKMGSTFGMAADSMSNLMMAAGGYKVLGFVKDSFVSAASAAIEFESAVTGIYKTVDGTPEQLQAISDAARDMALTMPSTTTEIAGVMESAGQLGIATDSVADFSKTMIDLGNSTNLTAEQAASSLAKFANITGMSADNYSNLGSVIVDLGNNFATTEADIVNMSTYLTSAASVAGFAETDILALSAAMSSVGINAEAGGSSMSKLISEMQTAVEVGGEGLQAFADVAGMTAQQFADEWGTNAVGALQAFIVGLNDVERNGKSMSVILQDLDLDDIRMSNMLKALAQGSDVMTSAVSRANTAWQENTALTNEAEKRYATLESKLQIMSNSANDLKISIGNALTPALSGLADAATGALKGLSSFADENQALTAGIMGTVGTVGTLAAGFVTVVPAISAVKTAWESLDIAMSASKIGLIVGGISVAVGTIAWLTTAFSDAEDAVEDYNGTLEECRNEIEQTKAEYDAVVSSFGAQSEAAEELKGQLETLNAQYEKGGGFAADYAERVKENNDSIKQLADSYRNQVEELDRSSNQGYIAISMLSALSDQSQLTNGDLKTMGEYADYLNDTFNCNIEVNYDTGKLTGFDPDKAINDVIAKMKSNRAEVAIEYVTSSDYSNNYIEAVNNAKAYQKNLNDIYKNMNDPSWVNMSGLSIDETIEALEAAKGKVDSLNDEIKHQFEIVGMSEAAADIYINSLTGMTDEADKTAAAAEGTGESISNYAQTASEKLSEIRAAYVETYEAALKSIQGQFGLFDEAAVKAEMSADKFIEAQKKQAQYWNDYAQNINTVSQYTAQELGMSEEAFDSFKIKLADGSQESVALAHEMANGSLESVKQMGKAYEQVYEAQGRASQATSEWQTGLSQTVAQTVTDTLSGVDSIINGINSKAGAFSAAGTNVGNAFTNAISSALNGAISAAQTVADSVQSILNNIHVSVPMVSGSSGGSLYPWERQYATGTLSAAPGLALVGEKGPELINFGGGEVVYTADETKRMMQGMTDVYIPQNLNEAVHMKEPEWNGSWSDSSGGSQDRTITINIGGDTIRVQGNISRDDVCDLLVSNLKPALMGIISEEIFEEGEGSYEY